MDEEDADGVCVKNNIEQKSGGAIDKIHRSFRFHFPWETSAGTYRGDISGYRGLHKLRVCPSAEQFPANKNRLRKIDRIAVFPQPPHDLADVLFRDIADDGQDGFGDVGGPAPQNVLYHGLLHRLAQLPQKRLLRCQRTLVGSVFLRIAS